MVTSADVAAGSVLNEVTVTDPLNPDEPVEGELSIVKPVHTVEKIALTDGFQREGDEIEYRIVVTNTGQVAINDLTVTDSLVTLTDAMREESLTSDGILEIGETWTYTYTYAVSYTHLDVYKRQRPALCGVLSRSKTAGTRMPSASC